MIKNIFNKLSGFPLNKLLSKQFVFNIHCLSSFPKDHLINSFNESSLGLNNTASLFNKFSYEKTYYSQRDQKRKFRKGTLPHKNRSKFNSPKKRRAFKIRHYSMPNHKGLLKRIRIVRILKLFLSNSFFIYIFFFWEKIIMKVGPRWNRKFKFMSASKRHLNRNKTTGNLR